MKNSVKRNMSVLLALVLLIQTCCISALAEDSTKKPVYKNFVIYGDSLCLGFSTESASMADTNTYDIEANILRAAQSADYRHCYPTQFANRVGIDTFSDLSFANGDMWNYRDEVEWNDVYNFGICAAWSSDIREILTDPYYLYQYGAVNYDKDDVYALPEDYTGVRPVVDTEAEGYDPADPSTWTYLTGEEYIDHYEEVFDWWTGSMVTVPVYKTEEYSLPAGTVIPVAFESSSMGTTYLMLNNIIAEKFFYVSEYCLDNNGQFVDTNEDGVVNDADILFYPVVLAQGPWGIQYMPDTEHYLARLGKAIQNPQFTKYYYDLVTAAAEEGDLIALAMGNNDIYHSFMPYQQSSDSVLCNLVYWLTYALQMNYTVSDILEMLNNPMWQGMIFGDSGFEPGGPAFAASDGRQGGANDVQSAEDGDTPASPDSPLPVGIAGIINADEINALLNLYSSENVSAYLKDTVEDYKSNYEATIRRVLALKQDKSELVLVGHYNPFGLINYLTMLSLAAQNGELWEHLSSDLAIIGTLLQAIIGTPEQWESINQMSEEELAAYAANANSEMESFLTSLGNLNLDDPDIDRAITDLLVDLSFPISVLLVGEALADTYANMNEFLQQMAEKYDLAYVNVSDAPSSGRYDPHPTQYGHAWIADRLYETVVPEITAAISPASTGNGVLTPLGNKEFRLRDSQTYSFLADEGSDISAIFIDGQKLDRDEYSAIYAGGKYTFEKIMSKHCITVQFDNDETGARKYAVNVLGSYAKYGGGEGMYKAGDTVHISAGALEGYEFTGWLVDGVTLDDNMSVNATFVMPENDVTATATWKVVEDDPSPTPYYPVIIEDVTQMYDLNFETNGGTAIPTYSKKSGTVVDLNAFLTVREGYQFDGWYQDAALTRPITTVTLNRNITVYAKWISSSQTGTGSQLPFIDVGQGDWFYNDVAYVYENGLMNGTGGQMFSPDLTLTRAMIVTMLYRLDGRPAVSGECPFVDVEKGSYYEDAVTWAAQNEIVMGYGDNRFGPLDLITREQMAAILYRYAGFKGYDVSDQADLSRFTDTVNISAYALIPMSWANAGGLITGMPDMTLQPGGNATRAQAAAILHRFCDWLSQARKI